MFSMRMEGGGGRRSSIGDPLDDLLFSAILRAGLNQVGRYFIVRECIFLIILFKRKTW